VSQAFLGFYSSYGQVKISVGITAVDFYGLQENYPGLKTGGNILCAVKDQNLAFLKKIFCPKTTQIFFTG
jgi:hypothetical protein